MTHSYPLNLTTIPLSLYIHLPWCVRKCPYCDFNSHTLNQAVPEDRYIDALLQDLAQDLPKTANRTLSSIFFGGGTPSLFSGKAINRILTGVKENFTCLSNMEVTLEANPGTVEHDHFAAYLSAGINRLSLGIQSFNPLHLHKLGRIHDHQQAIHAVLTAKAAGFTNFNIDLMFGLPEQTIENALNDLQQG